jgi:ionotropic glutamate receptor
MVATLERFKDADFSSAWLSGSYGILIPIPNSSTNIGALIEPFSNEV